MKMIWCEQKLNNYISTVLSNIRMFIHLKKKKKRTHTSSSYHSNIQSHVLRRPINISLEKHLSQQKSDRCRIYLRPAVISRRDRLRVVTTTAKKQFDLHPKGFMPRVDLLYGQRAWNSQPWFFTEPWLGWTPLFPGSPCFSHSCCNFGSGDKLTDSS